MRLAGVSVSISVSVARAALNWRKSCGIKSSRAPRVKLTARTSAFMKPAVGFSLGLERRPRSAPAVRGSPAPDSADINMVMIGERLHRRLTAAF